jgi:hypothetical protein
MCFSPIEQYGADARLARSEPSVDVLCFIGPNYLGHEPSRLHQPTPEKIEQYLVVLGQ